MCFTHNSKNSNKYQKIERVYISSLSFTTGEAFYNVGTETGKSIALVIAVNSYGTYDNLAFSVTNGSPTVFTIRIKNLSNPSANKNIATEIVYILN